MDWLYHGFGISWILWYYLWSIPCFISYSKNCGKLKMESCQSPCPSISNINSSDPDSRSGSLEQLFNDAKTVMVRVRQSSSHHQWLPGSSDSYGIHIKLRDIHSLSTKTWHVEPSHGICFTRHCSLDLRIRSANLPESNGGKYFCQYRHTTASTFHTVFGWKPPSPLKRLHKHYFPYTYHIQAMTRWHHLDNFSQQLT